MPNAADPDVVIRMLTAADFGDAHRLLAEAFGPRPPEHPPPTPESYMRPGRHSCGTFIDGEMVAHASGKRVRLLDPRRRDPDLRRRRSAGGRRTSRHRTPAWPVHRPARRGVGSRRDDLDVVPHRPGRLSEPRLRGCRVLRHGLGAGGPAGNVAAPAATTTRRAHLVDIAAVRSLYDTWAQAQTGPLTRRTAPFSATDAEHSESFTGITVAEDADGQPVGYAMWNRNRGPDGSTLDVEDLIALTPDAARALWRTLGTFA